MAKSNPSIREIHESLKASVVLTGEHKQIMDLLNHYHDETTLALSPTPVTSDEWQKFKQMLIDKGLVSRESILTLVPPADSSTVGLLRGSSPGPLY